MGPRRSEIQEIRIMDGKLALRYFIIVAMITLSYLNDEKADRMKHAITAVAGIHAAAK